MMRLLRTAAALLLGAAAVACDSPTGEKPQPKLPAIALGSTVEGRVVPGTADEFELAGGEREFRILLRVSTGSAADTLVAELVDERGGSAGGVSSVGTDTALSAQASGWLSAPAGSRWRIRVRGRSPDDGGPYTLLLFPRNPAPESVPAAITLNQTVQGEAVDVLGDVDEFTLEGTAGEEWIVFAEAVTDPGGRLFVELVEPGSGAVLGRVGVSVAGALEAQSTGRLVLTRAGTYRVRVSGSDSFHQEVRGAYRFRVAGVHRAPESGSAALELGGVAGDAIDAVGDVDEFTFTAGAGQEMNLLVQLEEGMSAGLTVELLRRGDPTPLAVVLTDSVRGSLNEEGTGRITLPDATTYTVRVSGPAAGMPAAVTGRYRFELYPVDRRPEVAAELRLDGPVVTGAVDRPGDVDEFPVAVGEGDLVMLHAAGGGPAGGALRTELVSPAGEVIGQVDMTGPATRYGRRITVPAAGTYTLRVGPAHHTWFGTGEYTVGAYTVSAAPEHVPSTLTVGQAVTAERIDRPGDLDVFTFTGTPGSQVNVFLGADNVGTIIAAVGPVSWPYPTIFTYAAGITLDATSTGRITLDGTQYQVIVDPQALSSSNPSPGGAYALRVFPIDTRPEGRPAAYVLGDTVKTEPLYPSGDIDEYTFTLDSSRAMRVFWQGPAPQVGIVVHGLLYRDGVEMPVWYSSGDIREFVLQPGSYRLRVLNPFLEAPAEAAGYGPATLNYRFAFVPQ